MYQGEVERKSCGTLKLTHGLEQSDQIYTMVCNTQGDAVKFSKVGGEIRIWEIVVIGTGKTLKNIFTTKKELLLIMLNSYVMRERPHRCVDI